MPKWRIDSEGRPGAPNDVRAVSIEHKLGLHASPTCVLSFGDGDDCVGELVGAVGGGMRAMFSMMNSARLLVGLQGVQVAEAATRKATRYAQDRTQGRRGDAAPAIVEHPDVRRMLLRMLAQTQAARALVYHAAGQVDRASLGDDRAASRVQLLTPLAKAHASDIGCEVTSLGLQVHGGMGYVEETGAARLFRDSRVFPIYEGTNGVQAADLVGRKLQLDGGEAFQALIADLSTAEHAGLRDLVSACGDAGRRIAAADADDRGAASYPFMTMLSVAVCGWLMERQAKAVGDDAFGRRKRTTTAFYLDQIVPEALGLRAAAFADASVLYAIPADHLVM